MRRWHRPRLQSPELYCSKIRFLYLAFEASLPVELRDAKTLGLLPPPASWGAHADERVEPDSPAKWDAYIHSEQFEEDEGVVRAMEKIADRFWTWFAISACFGGAAVTGLRESWEREVGGAPEPRGEDKEAEDRPNDVDIDLSEGEEEEGEEPDSSVSIEKLLGESDGEKDDAAAQ